jgi:hypothetical protein
MDALPPLHPDSATTKQHRKPEQFDQSLPSSTTQVNKDHHQLSTPDYGATTNSTPLSTANSIKTTAAASSPSQISSLPTTASAAIPSIGGTPSTAPHSFTPNNRKNPQAPPPKIWKVGDLFTSTAAHPGTSLGIKASETAHQTNVNLDSASIEGEQNGAGPTVENMVLMSEWLDASKLNHHHGDLESQANGQQLHDKESSPQVTSSDALLAPWADHEQGGGLGVSFVERKGLFEDPIKGKKMDVELDLKKGAIKKRRPYNIKESLMEGCETKGDDLERVRIHIVSNCLKLFSTEICLQRPPGRNKSWNSAVASQASESCI